MCTWPVFSMNESIFPNQATTSSHAPVRPSCIRVHNEDALVFLLSFFLVFFAAFLPLMVQKLSTKSFHTYLAMDFV